MRRLHPATVIVALLPKLREAVQAAIPIIIGSLASHHGTSQEWIGGLIACFTGVFAIGAYWTTRYDIETDHVTHRTGWIFRKDRRIPLKQIQNVNLRQNILERLFKVATVDVETAMGKGHDLKLSVLGLADAERFREELLEASHLEPASAAKTDEPIMSLNRHDLLLGAVTENHLGQMVVVFFMIWGPAIGIITKFAEKLPSGWAGSFICGSIALLLAGSWLWGVVSYFLKFGGFSVRRSETIFRISYGLLNKVQMVIRPARIEFINLAITLPQRLLGRASVHVGTASTFGEAGVLAPVALYVERDRANQSVAGVIPGLNVGQLSWRPFEPIFYRASAVRSLATITIFTATAFYLYKISRGEAGIVVWPILSCIAGIILLRLAGLFLSRPENGFAITEDALVVRRGYFHQTISAMPIERMENISLRSPFWWKKYQASSFSAQAMKHKIRVGAMADSSVAELMECWRLKSQTDHALSLYALRADEIEEIRIVEDEPPIQQTI